MTSARNFLNINAPLLRGPETNRGLFLMKLVDPGQRVKKGDLLAGIDAQQSADHVRDLADMVKRQAEQAIE